MTPSLSHSWGFEPIKYQRGVYLRCAVWRPNTTAALLVGDWKREQDRQRRRKRVRGASSARKHNRALQSTKKAVFILHLKTYEFFSPPPCHCMALTERENSPVKHQVYYSSNSCLKSNML